MTGFKQSVKVLAVVFVLQDNTVASNETFPLAQSIREREFHATYSLMFIVNVLSTLAVLCIACAKCLPSSLQARTPANKPVPVAVAIKTRCLRFDFGALVVFAEEYSRAIVGEQRRDRGLRRTVDGCVRDWRIQARHVQGSEGTKDMAFDSC
jgi:hypothetical protein